MEEPVLESVEPVSQRALGKLVSVYCKRIRYHSKTEMLGIVQQLRRLTTKGVTLHELQTALENYQEHVTRENVDPRLRRNIRSFFTAENIRLWQKPLTLKRREERPRDSALDVFDRFEELEESRGRSGK